MIAGHGMRANKAALQAKISRFIDDAGFGAAYIGDEPRGSRHARESAQHRRRLIHRNGKHDDVRLRAPKVAVERIAHDAVADGGINAKVTQEVWDTAVASLIAAIKDGRAGDGFVAAIEQCGAVLAQHFPVAPGSVNPDELPDKLVEM